MQASVIFGELPTTVRCGGTDFQIYTDFRTWMQVETILFDDEGTFSEKLPALLRLCYPALPETLEDAVFGMVCFYLGREPKHEAIKPRKKMRQLYSFRHDASLIYAGFYQQYGIDLTTANLHWFQFKALFDGLDETTRFKKVLEYRSVDVSMFENEEKRRMYRRLKELYRLPDRRSEDEREAEFFCLLWNLYFNRGRIALNGEK